MSDKVNTLKYTIKDIFTTANKTILIYNKQYLIVLRNLVSFILDNGISIITHEIAPIKNTSFVSLGPIHSTKLLMLDNVNHLFKLYFEEHN